MKSLSLSTPHIIALVGIPGSGKTHFARQFSETFSTPYINDQPLRYIARQPDDANSITLSILVEIMKTRQTILFEGQTDKRTDRTDLVKLAKKHGYKVLFVWVQADQSAARTRQSKQMSADEYDQRMKNFSAPHESEPYIVISGHHTYATQARAVLKHLTQSRVQATQVTQAPVKIAPTTPPARNIADRVRVR